MRGHLGEDVGSRSYDFSSGKVRIDHVKWKEK